MADIALATAAEVSIVQSIAQLDGVAGEALVPGAPVRYDANGAFVNANATDTTENAIQGIVTGKAAIAAGWPVTVIRQGVLDGFTFSQAYGVPIFLSDTDARLADAAGTTVVVVGHVIAGNANLRGVARDKLLFVNISDDLAFVDTTA